jgi:hypothetical protein
MSEEQPHDWLFKEIFSAPEHAASHLRSVLPAQLVARIDWDTLTVENTRLHISGLDAKQADVLRSAQLAGKPALLYIVPAPALARIRGASVAELERWTDRVLEAETLDDVLR